MIKNLLSNEPVAIAGAITAILQILVMFGVIWEEVPLLLP